jgi:Omp85 superfamily domain
MSRRLLPGKFCLSVCLLVGLPGSLVSVSAQTTTPPNPDQAKSTTSPQNSPEKSKTSLLHFNAAPASLINTPTSLEGNQQDAKGAEAVVSERKSDDSAGKKSEFVVAPFPISNPVLGSGLVVAVGYLFPLSKSDKVSPISMVGGGAFYTSNGSWLWAAGSKLYLKQDRFRVTWAFGKAQLHYDLYGIGNAAGDLGLSVPVNQGGKALLAEMLVRVRGKLFLGPRYQWRKLDAQLKGGILPEGINIDPIELKSTTSALGFHLQHDLRDNQFYPTSGTLADVVGDFFQGTFGSDFSYQTYTFAFNKYSGLTPKQVLAFRVFGCASAGHVPFYDLCLLGMHNDIRGYKAGQYRDKLMLTTQAEYRLELPKRFGVVAFFGVGEVAPNLGAFNNDNLKPGGGGGVRFTVAKKNHVNLRVDYAAGLQGGGVYMGVSEAF